LYGCAYGANCYSNERCRRKEPERISGRVSGNGGGGSADSDGDDGDDKSNIHMPTSLSYFEELIENVGFMGLFLILGISSLCCCCNTLIYAGAGALKGAYDDLAIVSRPPPTTPHPQQLQLQLQSHPQLPQQHVVHSSNIPPFTPHSQQQQQQHQEQQSNNNDSMIIGTDKPTFWKGGWIMMKNNILGRRRHHEEHEHSNNHRRHHRQHHQPIPTTEYDDDNDEDDNDNDNDPLALMMQSDVPPSEDHHEFGNQNDSSHCPTAQEEDASSPDLDQEMGVNNNNNTTTAIPSNTSSHPNRSNLHSNPDTDTHMADTMDDTDMLHDNDDENLLQNHAIPNTITRIYNHNDNNNNNNNNNNENNNTPTNTNPYVYVTPYPDPTRLPPPTVSSRHAKCLFNFCTLWYLSTLLLTTTFLFLSLHYYPQVPQYNVCSDELAWKSIIDGITSLKVEASFEILLSIENTNHFAIQMMNVGGTFRHDGQEVGTFTLVDNHALLERESITDVMLMCNVLPDRWEALGLVSEYYKGTLEFHADAHGSISLPWIVGNDTGGGDNSSSSSSSGSLLSVPVNVQDTVIKVNDPSLSDRHLCACPEWKDVKTKMPLLQQLLNDSSSSSSSLSLSSSETSLPTPQIML